MPQLKSILLAIELATRSRDDAAKALVQVTRNLGFSEEQMEQLEGYSSDTDSRWISAPAGMFSAEMIRHHYQFMDRLQQAIGLQTGVIAEAHNQVDQASRNLLQAEFRLSGLNQILKARQASLAQRNKRREQTVTDEFAAMAFFRSKGSTVHGETYDN